MLLQYLSLFLCLFSFGYSQCPLPGYNLSYAPEFNYYGDVKVMRVYVTCPGIATGVSTPSVAGDQYVPNFALYGDSYNSDFNLQVPLGFMTKSISYTSNSDGILTMNFENPVPVSQGYYWIAASADSRVPYCNICPDLPEVLLSYTLPCETSLEFDGNDETYFYYTVQMIMWLNVVSVTGTPCQADWECASSGANYDFATCVNGNCACQPNFAGSAIPEDVCRCDTSVGNQLAYDENGNPNCLSPGVCQVGSLVQTSLCAGYTQNYMFITCNNGLCQCEDGFQGSATAIDQCRCDYTLTWTSDGPICTDDSK